LDTAQVIRLEVQIGRLRLPNPILVASGTFGYGREMEGVLELHRLGGIVPKTITLYPRKGNAPPRTCETPAGMLNSIGLDNDGLEVFLERDLPYLAGIGPPIIVSIAGKNPEEYIQLAARLDKAHGVAGLELNLSCPNVSGGIDFSTDPERCAQVVAGVRQVTHLPILAKLTPNVTDLAAMAQAAAQSGADGLTLINTCLGMAVDWRRRRPRLGNLLGGLSGPAIKPIALRAVYQAARAVKIPIIGVGGIASIDDVMEFLVVGASAVQIGTANFYDPTVSIRILEALPAALAELGARSVAEVVGTLRPPADGMEQKT